MPSRYASASSGQNVCFQQQFVISGAKLAISLCGNQVTTSPRLCTCLQQVCGHDLILGGHTNTWNDPRASQQL
ncbi:hypothetical protein Hanom_Chr10g00910201 [Helianthus anomalus]